MRRVLPIFLLVLFTAPLEAQRAPKRDHYKIASAELAEYGTQNMLEVLHKARPHFLMFNAGSPQGMGEATMSGVPPRLVVYVGQQIQGDSSVLRFYRAADVKEVRFYKPNEAMGRLGANNAFVIQLVINRSDGT